MSRGRTVESQSGSREETQGAITGHEAELWAMADALRGSMEASDYQHVVLGLIFLKYISDAFEERYAQLMAEQAEGADPEDPDEYRAESVFWVPRESRWAALQSVADGASGKLQVRCGDILLESSVHTSTRVGIAPLNGVCSTDVMVVSPRKLGWYGFDDRSHV